MIYQPAASRYYDMLYKQCGNSGLSLPAITLDLAGLINGQTSDDKWKIVHTAFDTGINCFDLTSVHGRSKAILEEEFGRIILRDFLPYRDEMLITTKIGGDVPVGPSAMRGSKKHLINCLDQSMKRLGVDYLDILYHCPSDPDVCLEETMETLSLFVNQGKVLYIGLSNYNLIDAIYATQLLRDSHVRCILIQDNIGRYPRTDADELSRFLYKSQMGLLAELHWFTNILQSGEISAGKTFDYPQRHRLESNVDGLFELDEILGELSYWAEKRHQTLQQMIVSWIIKEERTTSMKINTGDPVQLIHLIKALDNLDFDLSEMLTIEKLFQKAQVSMKNQQFINEAGKTIGPEHKRRSLAARLRLHK